MHNSSQLILPTNLLAIPSRQFKLDRHSEYYSEDRLLMKQYQMVNFKELYERFDRFIIFGTELCPGGMLSDLRNLVREHESEWFSGKNTVVQRIISEMISSPLIDREERENLKRVNELLVGQIALVFTNRDPEEMIQLVESITIKKAYKVGEKIREDVYLYEGDTGLEPTRTRYFQACNIPTKIRKGQIMIVSTVPFLEKNTRVTPSQYEITKQLNMKPINCGCISKFVCERRDCCNYKSKVLKHNFNPSVYEAMNNLGALSLECNLVNQLTVIAELKKSIQNTMIIEEYVQTESEGNLFELD